MDSFGYTLKLFESMVRDRSGPSSNKDLDKEVPFKGIGSMQFDDYNYNQLNKMVFKLKEKRRQRYQAMGEISAGVPEEEEEDSEEEYDRTIGTIKLTS